MIKKCLNLNPIKLDECKSMTLRQWNIPELGCQTGADDIVRGRHTLHKLPRHIRVRYIRRQVDGLHTRPATLCA